MGDIFKEFESEELELAARVLGVREEDLPMMSTADREVTWQPPVETKGPGTYVNVKIPDDEVRLMDIVVHLRHERILCGVQVITFQGFGRGIIGLRIQS